MDLMSLVDAQDWPVLFGGITSVDTYCLMKVVLKKEMEAATTVYWLIFFFLKLCTCQNFGKANKNQ